MGAPASVIWLGNPWGRGLAGGVEGTGYPSPSADCKIFRSGSSALVDERAIRSKGETIMEQKNEKKSCCAGCACAPGACACGEGTCGCGPSCTCVPCTCPSACNC